MSGVDDDRPEEPENIVYVDDGNRRRPAHGYGDRGALARRHERGRATTRRRADEVDRVSRVRRGPQLRERRRAAGDRWFLLSTRAVADFTAKDTLEGGVGEITGTGYERVSQISPGWWPPWKAQVVRGQLRPGRSGQPARHTTGRRLFAPSCWSPRRSTATATSSGGRRLEPSARAALPRDFSKQFVSEKFYPTLQIFNPTLPKAGAA